MKFKVIIKYTYAELSAKSTQPELIRVHQINEQFLLTYLEENDYVITRDDLATLLKKDGADFLADSIRIYDEKFKCYFQVPEDFELEINPNQQSSIEMLLLIKSNDESSQKKLNELTKGLEEVQTEIKKISIKIDSIVDTQKILYENYKKPSQLPQLPSLHLSKSNRAVSHEAEVPINENLTIPKEEEEEDKLDSLGSLDAISEVDLKKQNSVIKYIEGEGQFDNLQLRMLDIAIVYSEPLVKKVGKSYESFGDPVDYEEECTKLLDILQLKKKKINLIFEIASHERLVSLMAKGPSILHVICQAEYNPEKKTILFMF